MYSFLVVNSVFKKVVLGGGGGVRPAHTFCVKRFIMTKTDDHIALKL